MCGNDSVRLFMTDVVDESSTGQHFKNYVIPAGYRLVTASIAQYADGDDLSDASLHGWTFDSPGNRIQFNWETFDSNVPVVLTVIAERSDVGDIIVDPNWPAS